MDEVEQLFIETALRFYKLPFHEDRKRFHRQQFTYQLVSIETGSVILG